MAFDRLTRYVATRREFKEDRDAHVTNLRLLETYLEQAKDWYPLLKKATLPVSTDVQTGTDAIVNVGDALYHLVGGVWTQIGAEASVGAVRRIETVDCSDASSVLVSNIPQDFKHLLVLYRLRTRETAFDGDELRLRINEDVNTYNRFEFVASFKAAASFVGVNPATPNIYARLLDLPTNFGAGGFADGEMVFSDYANPAAVKSVSARGITHHSAVDEGEFQVIQARSAVTAAITSLRFFTASGQAFETGSEVTLLGVPG